MATEYLNNKSFEKLIFRFQKAKKDFLKYKLFLEDISQTEEKMIGNSKYSSPKVWQTVKEENIGVCSEYREVQDLLAIAFYTLSQNIVRYAKFNLIDQDDAIQEGVMICFEKIDRFDAQKGKAFNYMTTCILNHFRQQYRTARNYNELKRKYLDFAISQMDKRILSNNKKNNYKQQTPLTSDD